MESRWGSVSAAGARRKKIVRSDGSSSASVGVTAVLDRMPLYTTSERCAVDHVIWGGRSVGSPRVSRQWRRRAKWWARDASLHEFRPKNERYDALCGAGDFRGRTRRR